MKQVSDIVRAAVDAGQTTLSEFDSKRILAAHGIPVTREFLVTDLAAARRAAENIGFPVVLKACSPDIAHKTEKGLIEVDLRNPDDLTCAWQRLSGRAGGEGGSILVQEMVKGARELVIGMVRDAQFGPSVMFGLGGIFTEVLEDIVFRLAPVSPADVDEMLGEIRGRRMLDAIRGMEAVDRPVLRDAIMALGDIGISHPEIQAIDVNPLIVRDGVPVAVDALVVLANEAGRE